MLRLLGTPLAAALERVARNSDRRAGIALVYHRVGKPKGDIRRELVPALGTELFARQLRYLSARYQLVTASDLLGAARARRSGERFPVAITFDDDLRSHVDVVAPRLDSAGAVATFFLTGATLEGPRAFWWELLQAAVDRSTDLDAIGLDASATIHELGRTVERLPVEHRERVAEALAEAVGTEIADAGLQTEHVESLAEQGLEIGFHTRRHDRLTELDQEALGRALRDGRHALEAAYGGRLTAIAYPHGAADARVAEAARTGKFYVGYTGLPVPVTPSADPLLLGRLSPSYDSLGELALDIAWTLVRAADDR